MSELPFVSVIIPVYNGEKQIVKCVEALMASDYSAYEIIVIDDCSDDKSVELVKDIGVMPLELHNNAGPAFARNYGARFAKGEILLFVDSDVVVQKDTISLFIYNFLRNKDVAAIFGSYDDCPSEKNFISQYRNLFHHFHHQHAETEATTFWAGCGAIKKEVFDRFNGFAEKKYRLPSVEDVELGYRISKNGGRILLCKDIQVKHLKRWELLPMLRTDIFHRAVPWSRLILKTNFIPNDLNLRMSHRLSTILSMLVVLFATIRILGGLQLSIASLTVDEIVLIFLLIAFFILNRNFYRFFVQKKGALFIIGVIPLHLLYYVYCGISFVACWIYERTLHKTFQNNTF